MDLQQTLAVILESEGYTIETAENGKQALQKIPRNKPDIILLDICLPDMSGMEVLENIEKKHSEVNCSIIMLTAFGDIQDAIRSMKLGAYDYITKPFNNDELIITIKKAIASQELTQEVKTLRQRLKEKVAIEKELGSSYAISEVVKKVTMIAPTNMSVIIQGKTGTGKEVIANLIHEKSARKECPFIPIDCGAIPENLIESELFGYEKGAFTGADATKKGKFEMANGGTLFLDEIANLPASAQSKLLRTIEEREVFHLGGKKPIKVDVRIITATNLDLHDITSNGDFREDLYHRLNEFKINLPLLKDRKEDIPILAELFLKEANREFHKKIKKISTDAMTRLVQYEWPGNVRELKNVLKKAVLLEKSDIISIESIELDEETTQIQNEMGVSQLTKEILNKRISLKEIMNRQNTEIEREIIQNILKEVQYNKTKAAKILKIDRNTLYARMKELGIDSR